MKIRGIQFFKSFSVYAIVMFFNAGISFAVFSWLTHHLSPDDFGTINLYSSYTILLLPFISFGVQFILSVDYFKMEKQQYRNNFLNGILVPGFMGLIFTAASFFFIPFLSAFLKVNTFFIIVVPFSCFLIICNDIIIAQIRNRGKHILYARYSIFKTITECLFTILLVAGFAMTWKGRLGAALVSLMLCGVFIFYLIHKWKLTGGRPEADNIRRIALQGLPFIPERLAIFFMAYSDRFFIDYFRGIQSVGLYGAGAQVGTIINLTTMALSYSFQPLIFRKMAEVPVDYEALRNVLAVYLGIAFLITVLLIIAVPIIFNYFIGVAFRESGVYAINLAIAGFFWAVYNSFLSFLLFLKKNKEIMFIAIAGMITSILLNIYNIKHFGPIGATYSNIAAYMLMATLVVIRVHRHYNLGRIIRLRFS